MNKINRPELQQLDTNFAPEGYYAKLATNDSEIHPCEGCAFEHGSDGCDAFKCNPFKRPDRYNVIFIKK